MTLLDEPIAPAAPLDVVDVSIVLPTLNEEESVGLCVREALNAAAAAGWSAEVVVVDNRCTDRSADVAASAGARVVFESTPGYGAALLCGIDHARGAVVVMADADCTYPLDRLSEVVAPVMAGRADLMLGSRLDAATRHTMPLLHRFVGTPVLTWLVRAGSGANGLSDSQSGFRAFRRDLPYRLGLQATGMEFASEMLIRAAQQGATVSEVPLGYRPRVGESKLSTWRDGWRHLRLILKLAPHLLLWYPGLLAIGLGVATYFATFAASGRFDFLGTTLILLGVLAASTGALLACHSPAASARTRAAFGWVRGPICLRAGLMLAAVGLGLDLAHRIGPAGVAQGIMLAGVAVAAIAAIYRLVISSVGNL